MAGLPVNPNPGENRGLQFGWAPPASGGGGFGMDNQAQAAREAQAARNRALAAQYGQQQAAQQYNQGGTTGSTGGSPMATANTTGNGLQQGALAMGGAGMVGAWQTPDQISATSPVFMGMQNIGGQNRPQTQTLQDVINSWYTMDQKTKDRFEATMASAGFKVATFTDADFFKAWSSYATQAASYNAAGKMLSPWDVLSMDGQGRQNNQPTTTTTTDTSYNISNYQDTHALFMQAAQSLLGRAPTVAETKAFQSQLNAYQRANPTKTTRTTTTDAQGNSTSTTSSSGGTTAAGMQDLAQQQAQQNPEYGSYQAATTYFNALLGAIGHM